ncbi:hypothetical protein WJX73_008354 [Symbiochloris irregularis]|uniref:MPN domain-containing protein n=1 Tax=Symbiochloris irregularis TaxID=706552 RepID=A0AAW1P4D3_9CHLO
MNEAAGPVLTPVAPQAPAGALATDPPSTQQPAAAVHKEPSPEISDTDSDADVPTAAARSALASLQVPATGPRPQSAAMPAAPRDGDDSGTDTDEDGNLIAQARIARDAVLQQKKPAPKRRAPSGKARVGGGISLRLLIEEGLLTPGEGVLTSEYKGANMIANLNADGRISYTHKGQLMTFESPSAFSIFFKRLVNPSRKADDGWKTVRYQGRFLDHYKMELARRRFGDGQEGSGSLDAPAEGPPPPKRTRVDPVAKQHSGHLTASLAAMNGQKRPPTPQAPIPSSRPSTYNHSPVAVHSYASSNQEGAANAAGGPQQPFRLAVAAEASVLIDFHSHLSNNEICGILGGTWNASERLLTVQCARPVQNASESSSGDIVQMDPDDRRRVQEDMKTRLGVQCVGFYHSRPTRPARPSLSEVREQLQQQQEHSQGAGFTPLVTAICTPFDPSAPAGEATSALNWVFIASPPDYTAAAEPLEAGCKAYTLEVEDVVDSGLTGSLPKLCEAALQELISRYASQWMRADMMGAWQGGQGLLDKFKASLAVRLPMTWPEDQVEGFVNFWAETLKLTWENTPVNPPSPNVAAKDPPAPAKPLEQAAGPPSKSPSPSAISQQQRPPLKESDSDVTEDERPPRQTLQGPGYSDDTQSDETR